MLPEREGYFMLTDVQIRNARAKPLAYKLTDSGGLHVYVSPAGGKSFRWKYRFGGKEKLLTIGRWPAMSLAKAREAVAVARAELASDRDPAMAKRQASALRAVAAGGTLRAIATEWHRKQITRWAPKQHVQWMRSMEMDIFPTIGDFPIGDITAPMLLAVLNKVERRGAVEKAHRLRQRLDSVFSYAIATSRATVNAAGQLRGQQTPADKTGKQPAAITLPEARAVYADISNYPAQMETRSAAQIGALTAARPGDVRMMRWDDITDLDGPAPVWIIAAEQLKGTKEQKAERARRHIVPLSPQAVAVLKQIFPLTGHMPLCFPSPRYPKRPITDMTLSMLYRRAGWEGRHVPHGWRASFSTLMNERHPAERDAIDAALAHVKGGVEGRYNRAEHLLRRRELFAEWAEILTRSDTRSKGETE
jgi:integrase